eukprot:TRINITY_DN2098_c0_g3_i1.p1 TRINITY_DN2098_c0_g3~~TRINITY_DN2098_c0_g3_i1.p1  ORF type:complete len:147 (+),score=22.77 TRINITY_DN2098_c0_g3_i1:339-779(+)
MSRFLAIALLLVFIVGSFGDKYLEVKLGLEIAEDSSTPEGSGFVSNVLDLLLGTPPEVRADGYGLVVFPGPGPYPATLSFTGTTSPLPYYSYNQTFPTTVPLGNSSISMTPKIPSNAPLGLYTGKVDFYDQDGVKQNSVTFPYTLL